MGILSKPDLKTLFTNCNKVAALIDSLMHVSENGLLITTHSVAANGNVTLRFSDGSFLTIEKEDLAALLFDVKEIKSFLNFKVNTVDGKQLSTNDLTDDLLALINRLNTTTYTKEEVDEFITQQDNKRQELLDLIRDGVDPESDTFKELADKITALAAADLNLVAYTAFVAGLAGKQDKWVGDGDRIVLDDGSTVSKYDIGGNIGNKDLILTEPRVFDLAKFPLEFRNAQDKSDDPTYNRFAIFNERGDLTNSDGINAVIGSVMGMTKEQRAVFNQVANPNVTISGMHVLSINPSLVVRGVETVSIVRGLNLMIASSISSVYLIGDLGTEVTIVSFSPMSSTELKIVYTIPPEALDSVYKLTITQGTNSSSGRVAIFVVSQLTPIEPTSWTYEYNDLLVDALPSGVVGSSSGLALPTEYGFDEESADVERHKATSSKTIVSAMSNQFLKGDEDWVISLLTTFQKTDRELKPRTPHLFGVTSSPLSLKHQPAIGISLENSGYYCKVKTTLGIYSGEVIGTTKITIVKRGINVRISMDYIHRYGTPGYAESLHVIDTTKDYALFGSIANTASHNEVNHTFSAYKITI